MDLPTEEAMQGVLTLAEISAFLSGFFATILLLLYQQRNDFLNNIIFMEITLPFNQYQVTTFCLIITVILFLFPAMIIPDAFARSLEYSIVINIVNFGVLLFRIGIITMFVSLFLLFIIFDIILAIIGLILSLIILVIWVQISSP